MTFSIITSDQKEYMAICVKHARDEKEALSYILKTKPDKKTKFCVFKKGMSAKLLNIEILPHLNF